MSRLNAEQIFEFINSRHSDGHLVEPAPTEAELQQAVLAALTAPDHHRLQPWRFLTVRGDARHRMGEAFQQALIARGETDEALLSKVLTQPLRAPLILVCAVVPQEHPKVPVVEQVLSMGAAVENLLLMLVAQGYSGMWRTGAITESPVLKQAFGLRAEDIIAGFVYIGSTTRELTRELPAIEGFLKEWHGS